MLAIPSIFIFVISLFLRLKAFEYILIYNILANALFWLIYFIQASIFDFNGWTAALVLFLLPCTLAYLAVKKGIKQQ